MNFSTKSIITNFSLESIIETFKLKHGDGYAFVKNITSLNKEVLKTLKPKKFIIINNDTFPFNNQDYTEDIINSISKFTAQIINNLLLEKGYLIIVDSGENFINTFIKKYLKLQDFTLISSLEDVESTNDLLEGNEYLTSTYKKYGKIYKYYILVKNSTNKIENFEFPSIENQLFFNLDEYFQNNNTFKWSIDFNVLYDRYTLNLTIFPNKMYIASLKFKNGIKILDLNENLSRIDTSIENLKLQLLNKTKSFFSTQNLLNIQEMNYTKRISEKLTELV